MISWLRPQPSMISIHFNIHIYIYIPENTGESKMTRKTKVATKIAQVLLSEASLRSIFGPDYWLSESVEKSNFKLFEL